MKRRNFLKTSAALSLLACCPTFLSGATNYNGKLLLTVYANGGWDPTSFCDPKTNVAGEPIINNWAKTQGIQKAGNISYAPFADNKNFFTKHYKKMLVINGIDQKTNSHERGELYSTTGTMNDGFPSLSAHLANTYKTNELMPWVHNGFRPQNGGLLAPALVTDRNAIRKLKLLAEPNIHRDGSTDTNLPQEDVDLLRSFRARFAMARANDTREMPKQREQYTRFLDSTFADTKFQDFIDNMEKADTKGLDANGRWYGPAIAALSAFSAGVSLSAEVRVSNFDTHNNHDVAQAERLTELTNTLDLVWNLAEQFNLKDRLVVLVVSDIGRTNKYNSKGGKDHWSTNSSMIMANNPSWGNRVVGASTNKHYSEKINFNTFKVDPNGTKIEPKHVIASLRQYFGVSKDKFDLDISDSIDLFDANKST